MLITHLTSTLRAPSGVTIVAGAKAYAAKFMHSPEATEKEKSRHSSGECTAEMELIKCLYTHKKVQ